jgi:catechol 2,3-dioxygenase-like lactoylglutathione lyase family enzyme
MLSDYRATPVLAVSDLARARRFYEVTLGLRPQEAMEGVMYEAADGHLFVYPSAYAGTNRATAVSFTLPPDAFGREVEELRRRGVDFQTFQAEGATWHDGVADFGAFRAVWFEDPDGNVLNVESEV